MASGFVQTGGWLIRSTCANSHMAINKIFVESRSRQKIIQSQKQKIQRLASLIFAEVASPNKQLGQCVFWCCRRQKREEVCAKTKKFKLIKVPKKQSITPSGFYANWIRGEFRPMRRLLTKQFLPESMNPPGPTNQIQCAQSTSSPFCRRQRLTQKQKLAKLTSTRKKPTAAISLQLSAL